MNNEEYSLQDYFGMLIADDSWEEDPQMRQMLAMGLMGLLSIY